jgi:hypothetical protein
MFPKLAAGLLLFCAFAASAQAPAEARFASVFENPQVAVYSIELAPRSHATVFQGTHDVIWIALSGGSLNFARRDRNGAVDLKFGDVRFFREFELKSVSNELTMPARGVLIEIKARGAMPGCGCSTPIERAVCGCGEGGHLPELWALGFGRVTLGGTTLHAGQSFLGSSFRDDMLMVAVSDVDLKDDAAAQPAEIKLAAGETHWFASGAHQFRNLGTDSARFVTIEF